MSTTADSLDNLPLSPQPREVNILDGTTELCSDVRLATSDVLPFVRKSMRGVLSSAGIRVVANKKKFVVYVNVVSRDQFHLDDLSEEQVNDYYEIDIVDNIVTIRSPAQPGAVWGIQTYTQIYGLKGPGAEIPNVHIRDWSEKQYRGIYLPATSGIGWMRADEVYAVMDRITREKMNVFAFGVYGQNISSDGKHRVIDEKLFYPYEHDEEAEEIINPPYNPYNLKWFSPKYNMWENESFYPRIIENDGIDRIATYARENALYMVPSFHVFVKSPLLISMYPEIAGVGDGGEKSSDICCLTSQQARKRYEELFDVFLEKALPRGSDYFMADLDSVPPLDEGEHWCQCEECQKKGATEILLDFISFTVETLTAKGVSSVVLSSTDGRAQKLIFDSGLLARLEDKGYAEQIIIHAKDIDSEADKEIFWGALNTSGAQDEKMPEAGQMAEIISRLNPEQTQGFVAKSSPASFAAPLEAELGTCLWNACGKQGEDAYIQVFDALCPHDPQALSASVLPLLDAVDSATFSHYLYELVTDKSLAPLALTAEILSMLKEETGGKCEEKLRYVLDKAETARKASDDLLETLYAEESTDEALIALLKNNAADAVRLNGLADYLLTMLPHENELFNEKFDEEQLQSKHGEATQKLTQVIASLEERLSSSMAPYILHELSMLLPQDG